MGAKFFTLGEGSYKYGKEEKLKSIKISKQVIRNMKKKTYVQLILKEAIFSRKDGCQTNAWIANELIQKRNIYGYNKN